MMVCRHIPPAPGCHLGPGSVTAQSGEFVPGLAAVGRAEQRGVFDSGIDRVWLGERRLEVPDPLEFPGMLRAVVPLMRGERFAGLGGSVVGELVALASGIPPGPGCGPPPGISQVLPPSLERWITCPNQPLVCDA